jgi:hypothetical protein
VGCYHYEWHAGDRYVFNNPLSYTDPTGYAGDGRAGCNGCTPEKIPEYCCGIGYRNSEGTTLTGLDAMYYLSDLSAMQSNRYDPSASSFGHEPVPGATQKPDGGYERTDDSIKPVTLDVDLIGAGIGAGLKAGLLVVAKLGEKGVAKALGSVPKPPTGKGATPLADRDSKRVWTKSENQAKLDAQGGKCANCGKETNLENSAGHHVKRHADGGKTNDANHAVVCDPCHIDLHK